MALSSERSLLAGVTAYVTGGTRGIGWEVARTLAAHGAAVAISGRDATVVADRAAEIKSEFSVDAFGIAGDVALETSAASAYKLIFARWKRLDVLVNNAGVLEDALLGMIPGGLVDRVIDTNAKGAIYHLQGAARLMSRRRSGAIINMASIVGVQGNEGQAVYASSKAALIGLTKAAAKELAPLGIRVNAVAPGYIDTDMIKQIPPNVHAERLAQIGLGRIGTPRDIANAVLFLASEMGSYITGQVLGVDGGMRL